VSPRLSPGCHLAAPLILAMAACMPVGCHGGTAAGATVAVVGIDSGDWDLIDPYLDAGQLPNLARLRRDGASARLDVDSAFSPVSWTTLATGHHPDVHGVSLPDRREDVLQMGGDQVQVKRLWDIAGAGGKRSLVVDYWLTHPAYAIEGVMIGKAAFAPAADIPGGPSATPADAHQRIGRPIEPTALREELGALDLLTDTSSAWMDGWMQDEGFDLLVLPIYPVDVALHMLWSEHAAVAAGVDLSRVPTDEGERTRRGHDLVFQTLLMADELVGRALDYVGDGGYVIVVSDHGHTGTDSSHRRIAISRALLDGGGGTVERGTFESEGATIRMEATHRWVDGAVLELTYRLGVPELTVTGDGAAAVTDRLLAARTAGGEPVLRERRHKLIPSDTVLATAAATLGRHVEPSFSVFVNSGYHRVEDQGVFAVLGPGVQAGSLDVPVASVDVAPTALWLLGLPVGEDMAGHPVTAALTDRAARRRPVRTIPTHEDGTRPWATGSAPTVTPEALERMKALGYVD
jgi:predicted AlkP superfamily phosphohydrolase/phosphomutase